MQRRWRRTNPGKIRTCRPPAPITMKWTRLAAPTDPYHAVKIHHRFQDTAIEAMNGIDWVFRLKLILILSQQLFTDWIAIFKSILVFIRSDVTTKTLTTSIILWSPAPYRHASKYFLTKKSQRRSKFFQLHPTYLVYFLWQLLPIILFIFQNFHALFAEKTKFLLLNFRKFIIFGVMLTLYIWNCIVHVAECDVMDFVQNHFESWKFLFD